MHIRKSTSEDFEQIYALLNQLWPGAKLSRRKLRIAFRRALRSDHQHYLCAVDNQVIIGLCTLSMKSSLWQQGTIAHIDELVVDQVYRGRGIGTALMKKAFTIAGKRGCSQIELDSAFHRKRAHSFYERLGFENRAYVFSRKLT
jgi:ribosomal protein S18 acetylase RimI-like enzyme